MKRLLLSFALAMLAVGVNAADHSNSAPRNGGKLYRRAPRGGSLANLSADERMSAVICRPTQHYYTQDSVISYRYTAVDASEVGSEYGGTYFGPNGAQFVPTQDNMAPDARIRSYASVHKRHVSGVPMSHSTQQSSNRGHSSSVIPVSDTKVAVTR